MVHTSTHAGRTLCHWTVSFTPLRDKATAISLMPRTRGVLKTMLWDLVSDDPTPLPAQCLLSLNVLQAIAAAHTMDFLSSNLLQVIAQCVDLPSFNLPQVISQTMELVIFHLLQAIAPPMELLSFYLPQAMAQSMGLLNLGRHPARQIRYLTFKPSSTQAPHTPHQRPSPAQAPYLLSHSLLLTSLLQLQELEFREEGQPDA